MLNCEHIFLANILIRIQIMKAHDTWLK